MTFKDLLTQLHALSPEQLEQEVIFVKYGACSDYDWEGLVDGDYYENSDRLQLQIEQDGVWLVDNDFYNGITDGLTKEELEEEDDKELIVPPGMPFFNISEN